MANVISLVKAMAMKCWWCVHMPLMFCFLLCSFSPTNCLQNETDRLSLLSFKHSIQNDPFQVFNSWNDSVHYCNWQGVSCGRRHPHWVVALNLSSRGLVGSLSPHIGNLSFLRIVDLGNNSFHGHIPQEIGRLRRLQMIFLTNNTFSGKIPTNVSNCLNLVLLHLYNNHLVGNIPPQLGSLQKLQTLILSINSLTGSIPSSLGNLSSLVKLSLLTNNLTGHIPQEFSQLRSLSFLLLSDNDLIGEIPSGIYNISDLQLFEVDFNQLNGSIPSDIGLAFPKLTSLILAYNMFNGMIPLSLSNASALEQVFFTVNSFTGLIPKDLGNLPNLQLIGFDANQVRDDLSFFDSLTNCSKLTGIGASYNFLRGSIPSSVANLSKQMQFLELSGNQLNGYIPLGIENLFNLRFLFLDQNYLSGSIDINFSKLLHLENLQLNTNKFSGTIPLSIGNLSWLSVLYMDDNNLHGSIPPSLGNCHNLIDLDLSHNNLTGSIPTQVIGLSSLSTAFNVASNALTGPIPSEVELLRNLEQLDLSDNKFSGIIPTSIAKCLRLESLRLGGNSLQGNIPEDFGVLRGLVELDISRNDFWGKIPSSIAELDGLNYLNLSFNHLQGEVPKRGIFLNASRVLLLGNNGLCGGITELKLPSCPSTNSKRNSHPLLLRLVIPIVVAAILLGLLVCFFIFRHIKKMFKKKNIISELGIEPPFLRISYAELFKATDGFSAANIIGVGSYGSVYEGILEQSRIQVAVKVLNLQQRGASSSFMSECRALRSIRHRNLLKLLSVCSSIDFQGNDFKALVYEFMANGNLEKWLHNNGSEEDQHNTHSSVLKLPHRLNIAIDIASAVEYLHRGHSSTIIHGDLKPSNVLLDAEMTAHIGDFGLAKIVSIMSTDVQHIPSSSAAIRGTIGYVAPEYGMGDLISVEGDVYSYGIVLLEMFTGKKPTDEYFRDDLSLHSFVERGMGDRVMEIVDPCILCEDEGGRFMECIISVLNIGVACSREQAGQRMEMGDVISELQKIKASYQKALLTKNPRKA